ncbi:MAG: MFS transporter [Tepidisphaera sp.]
MPDPVVSSPPFRTLSVLPIHIAGAVMVQATQFAIAAMIPIIAIKHFSADARQSVILTAAQVVLFALSIFWNAIFERSPLGRFWLVYWMVACLPVGLAALSTGFAGLAVCWVIGSVGLSAYHPASGELLKRLYPDSIRGRIYGVIQTVSMLSAAGFTHGIGTWLERDSESFRTFLPLAAGVQAVGVLILWRLATSTGIESLRHRRTRTQAGLASALRAAVEPLLHMREALAADRRFARYEAAFMTYGVGWMICNALLPILATERLKLDYHATASAGYMSYQLTIGLCMIPAGLLLDRFGAARATSLAFLALAAYPVLLVFTQTEQHLAWASLFYGVTHAGVSAGWMLGPVSLAPTPARVPQYVAIHATLVGIRGAVFQVVGVYLYVVTGSFTWPLIIASLSLIWAAWQMLGVRSGPTKVGPPPQSDSAGIPPNQAESDTPLHEQTASRRV